MDCFGDLLDIVNRPEDVAGVSTCDEPRSFTQQALQTLDVEFRIGVRLTVLGLSTAAPPFDRESSSFGQLYPGRDVGFVIELRQDELVAILKSQRRGEVPHKLRGG